MIKMNFYGNGGIDIQIDGEYELVSKECEYILMEVMRKYKLNKKDALKFRTYIINSIDTMLEMGYNVNMVKQKKPSRIERLLRRKQNG